MPRDDELLEELSEQAASCTECTGLTPALTETGDAEVRALYAVEKAKRSGKKRGE